MPRKMLEGTILPSPAGAPVWFPAGTTESDLPEWARPQINATSIWGDQAIDDPPATVEVAPGSAAAASAVFVAPGGSPSLPSVVAQPDAGLRSDGPPPKAGRGSSRDAWAAYAEKNGVTVVEEMNRDDIVDALEKAKIPVE